MSQAPQLSLEQAREALGKCLHNFETPANLGKIKAAMAEISALPAEEQAMAKMMRMMPLVTEIQSSVLRDYGFPESALMMAAMQIQQYAPQDADIAAGCQRLMAGLQGNF